MAATGNEQRRRVTIRDIAKAADVSIATVSFVLNETGSVGEEVRKRVIASAAELGYRPNQRAMSMRTGRSNTIGLVIPDIDNPFFPGLARSIEEAARNAGFAVLLADAANGSWEREGLDRLERHGVDGICWCPSTQIDVARDLKLTTPIVLVCRSLPGYDVVMADERSGAQEIWRHIMAARYRRIGLIFGSGTIPGADVRGNEIRHLMRSHDILAWEIETAHSMTIEQDVAVKLLEPDLDLVLCPNDLVAVGVMRFLRENGRRIPEDVAVIGFDDIAWAEIVSPGLTTVRQPVAELGHEAVAMLLDRIANSGKANRTMQLGVGFIERRSTRVMSGSIAQPA